MEAARQRGVESAAEVFLHEAVGLVGHHYHLVVALRVRLHVLELLDGREHHFAAALLDQFLQVVDALGDDGLLEADIREGVPHLAGELVRVDDEEHLRRVEDVL